MDRGRVYPREPEDLELRESREESEREESLWGRPDSAGESRCGDKVRKKMEAG